MTDNNRFHAALARVFGHEGGFADDPDDPGGATMMGITHATLTAWRGRPVTTQEVKSLTRKEATAIYKTWYWDAVRGDDIDSGLAYTLFDFYVNTSPRGVAKAVQRAVGAKVDGVMGPQTWGLLLATPTEVAIMRIAVERLKHMRSLSHWWKYKNGWTTRVHDVQDHSLKLTREAKEPQCSNA
jgi:lysozyme family protein